MSVGFHKPLRLAVLGAALLLAACSPSNLINRMMPKEDRPEPVPFQVERLTPAQFDSVAMELRRTYPQYRFDHIRRFKEAGIYAYEGPKTCLQCHKTITVVDPYTHKPKTVDLMDNLLTSAHYRFFTMKHPEVWGFNGKLADDFPMGKIDRPCPKPGSFAISTWAEIVRTRDGREYSEGCGMCHIGGQYNPPLGEIMPLYAARQEERDAIDCLICHAVAYDMNQRVVVQDPNGRTRWGQDRSLRAALSVGVPTAQNCLRCHQHNFGGDIYVDSLDPSYMQSRLQPGYHRPRVFHPGSKRGTPYSPSWDVHAAAGLSCIDCHTTMGHYIARGTHTTTLMANDLPGIEVSCEQCHGAEPHRADPELADYLNMHTEKIACQTCHIPSLHPDNVTLRDFAHPEYEEEEGIYIYTDMKKEWEPGKGIVYKWWNGDCTFLGTPIGDNPNGEGLYDIYKPNHVWPEFQDFDYAKWQEEVLRPIARQKPSKIWAMKLYNGRQHIDLQNMGPFGGMFVPYNLPTYYATGDPDSAAKVEMRKPIMKMMYGWMFKKYLMDKFMSFMDIPGWNTKAYDDVVHLRKVEPRWLPSDAFLEISHAIRKEGALSCTDCHSPNGVLDFKALGYSDEEVADLIQNPLE